MNTSSLSADIVSPGTMITVMGSAVGGTGEYGYQYYYKRSTSRTWQYLENAEPDYFYGDYYNYRDYDYYYDDDYYDDDRCDDDYYDNGYYDDYN